MKGTGLASDTSFASLEASKAIFPFASFGTIRTKYQLDDITIDLDEASFGYDIGEIELIVGSPAEAEAAETRIRALASSLKLDMIGGIRGKLIEYIFRNDPTHYEALRKSGALRERQ